jgi:hypothetical protein
MTIIEELRGMIPHDIICVYQYGSKNYGTYIEGKSDSDYIVIYRMDVPYMEYKSDTINISGYNMCEYIRLMKLGEMSIIESWYRPLYVSIEIKLDYDITELRSTVSKKTDNSYVKAKKKLTIEKDYYIAKKSLFHCLRILMYAIELLRDGQITFTIDVRSLYDDIMMLPEDPEKWQEWDTKYRPMYNGLKSEFKKYAPKK